MSYTLIRTIDDLITALGGEEALGTRLGCGRTGVAMWKTRGYIPTGWHLRLFLMLAAKRMQPAPDLFELPEDAFDAVAQAFPVPVPPRKRPASRPRARA